MENWVSRSSVRVKTRTPGEFQFFGFLQKRWLRFRVAIRISPNHMGHRFWSDDNGVSTTRMFCQCLTCFRSIWLVAPCRSRAAISRRVPPSLPMNGWFASHIMALYDLGQHGVKNFQLSRNYLMVAEDLKSQWYHTQLLLTDWAPCTP